MPAGMKPAELKGLMKIRFLFLRSSVLLAVTGLIGLALLIGGCSQGEESQVKLIPRHVLFDNPDRVNPRLSPNGELWSYLAPYKDVMNIWVSTVGAADDRPVTRDSARGIQYYFWGGQSDRILYLEDDGGNENWRLCAVDIETMTSTCLTPFEGVQVRIIERNKNFPNQLIIGMNKDNPQLHDVYRLNIITGDLDKVATNPGNVAHWFTDADFKLRGALAANDIGGFDLMVRPAESGQWRSIISWDSENAMTAEPIGFDRDGSSLYVVDSRDANAGRLCRVDAATGEIEQVVLEHPRYDVTNVVLNPDTHVPEWAVIVTHRDSIVVLDDGVRDDIEAVKALHHGDPFLTSRDDADDTWMIGFVADDGPIPYYSFQRTTNEATFLFYHRPELLEYELASMEPIEFEARDGLRLHGYITFPPGQERQDLPMVLKVHGGPWARDTWGWSSEVQWLANRGYAVLQVNYRGSAGYGKDFMIAADGEWGGKMLTDLVDGVNWAIAQGYADPGRVAIYGYSFGGYAALCGAAFTPEVFSCAVDLMGISNLLTFMESIPAYWESYRRILYERVGHPVEDRDLLRSRSPLFYADQIEIPMLIGQGANDPRVSRQESEQIVEALEKNGVAHEYLLFEDEGHGLARPENRLEFYNAAEKFLADCLGGRIELTREGEVIR